MLDYRHPTPNNRSMESFGLTPHERKRTAVESLRGFAHTILELAALNDIVSPMTANDVMSATPNDLYVAQHHWIMSPEDIAYWKAQMKKEYDDLVAEKFGFTPPPPDTVLDEGPAMRRYQSLSDAAVRRYSRARQMSGGSDDSGLRSSE